MLCISRSCCKMSQTRWLCCPLLFGCGQQGVGALMWNCLRETKGKLISLPGWGILTLPLPPWAHHPSSFLLSFFLIPLEAEFSFLVSWTDCLVSYLFWGKNTVPLKVFRHFLIWVFFGILSHLNVSDHQFFILERNRGLDCLGLHPIHSAPNNYSPSCEWWAYGRIHVVLSTSARPGPVS